VTDKYAQYAEESLAERGIQNPSTELLRFEMAIHHMAEAESLAATLGLRRLEKKISEAAAMARDDRYVVELISKVAPQG